VIGRRGILDRGRGRAYNGGKQRIEKRRDQDE
jgi:hypothetical protein